MQQWETCTIKVKQRWGLFKSAWRWIAVVEAPQKPKIIAKSAEYSVQSPQDADRQEQELAKVVSKLLADGWEQVGPYRFQRPVPGTEEPAPEASTPGDVGKEAENR